MITTTDIVQLCSVHPVRVHAFARSGRGRFLTAQEVAKLGPIYGELLDDGKAWGALPNQSKKWLTIYAKIEADE